MCPIFRSGWLDRTEQWPVKASITMASGRQYLAKLERCPIRCNKCLKPAANMQSGCVSLGTKEWRLEWCLTPLHPITHWNIVLLPCAPGFGWFRDSSTQEKNLFLREYWDCSLVILGFLVSLNWQAQKGVTKQLNKQNKTKTQKQRPKT